MIKKYTKLPVTIEAVEYTDETRDFILGWVPDAFIARSALLSGSECVTIPTLEGDMQCFRGDFVVRGVKGEFYPCKPDIFWMTYVEEPSGNNF